MKLIVLLCVMAVATAAPPAVSRSGDSHVLKQLYELDPAGSYKYEWETSDGSSASAVGEFHQGNGKDSEGFLAVRGSYAYVGQDGVSYTVNYVADENGFRPELVQGPNGAIPDEVIKNLPKP